MLMTVEIGEHEISLEYRLATPNGDRSHKSGSVSVELNMIEGLGVISREEMRDIILEDDSVYFSEMFIDEIGKTLVLCFSGRAGYLSISEEAFDGGPFVLKK